MAAMKGVSELEDSTENRRPGHSPFAGFTLASVYQCDIHFWKAFKMGPPFRILSSFFGLRQ